ncbi:hypothetical protein NFI96_027461, partial [Prochilodus magdalenae]
ARSSECGDVKLKTKRMENRWKYKPSIPSVVMGNVNSLASKTDELAALVRNQWLYRECSLLCLMETWLTGNIPDTNINIPSFTTITTDRDARLSGKSKESYPTPLPEIACDVTRATIARLQTQHPDAFIAISGDFNHITLDSVLTAFHQYLDCPTRKNRTINLLYPNVKDAYTATLLPPLGKSDHNLVYLQPQYTPRFRTQPITTRSFRKWSPGAEAALRD